VPAGVTGGEGTVAPPVKEKPITPDKLYEAIKRFFANAASAAEAGDAIELEVTGKGNVKRLVPLPVDVLKRLERYLVSRGLPPSPFDCPEGTPLIGKLGFNRDHTGGHLSGDHVEHCLKGLLRRAAAAAPDDRTWATLRRASTHWLRHTFGSHALANGIDVDVTRQSLGHASIDTTSIYSNVETARRHRQTQEFADRGFRRARKQDT
jgi:site-specific recombinase XerD